ncbi:DUF4435 domain-containing protein [Shewanella baltica]|uniref:DUF4435 domain-containing protein n=1 Tax=Shewanella baltica TaxID=62322 RepID=UPI002167A37B|nr:DUF4435 domain-containing protein [Shewanella baltica]MCS6114129.1 DUF4435 domain-containing protein [Shewanella baltica]UVW62883.1 DUF4435 domain-containing protein [Shewanella baltica]
MTSCLSQTAEEIVTEISMSVMKLPWIVIEGGTDSVFFSTKRFLRKPILVTAKGWENVVGVVAKVIEENIAASVFGFIDRDYREHLGISIDERNIVISDLRDLEVSMFESDGLHRILLELGSANKLPSLPCGSVDVSQVRNAIYAVASKLGKLRYFSLKYNKKYSFKKLDFSKIINISTLELINEKLIAQLNSVSDDKIDQDFLNSALATELPEKLLDARYLCSGHDIAELFGLSLRRMWGSNNTKEVEREKIESQFRISYSNEEFENTKMFLALNRLLEEKI